MCKWCHHGTLPGRSHDIPEAMAYNRLAKMARGHVIMIIPDDMVLNLADDCSWVRNIQTLFERLPLVSGEQHNTKVSDCACEDISPLPPETWDGKRNLPLRRACNGSACLYVLLVLSFCYLGEKSEFR